ncbi:hypothetical protein [Paraburkholderia sp.]|uniref:hypothetical protein n=1 Tax=Paraburkholderia sp. TaxID=1926495 RepID=UPI0039E3357B
MNQPTRSSIKIFKSLAGVFAAFGLTFLLTSRNIIGWIIGALFLGLSAGSVFISIHLQKKWEQKEIDELASFRSKDE